jgi:uncharacterized repeat protein (TIGR01451 family)
MKPFRFLSRSLFGKSLMRREAAVRPLRRGTRGLGFESLESRQMMAADLAEIVGTVRLDVNGDGSTAGDPVVADAMVALYRDNGNGMWDAGDAMVGSPENTDGFGRYRFDGVSAGKYFLKLSLPPALQAKNGGDIKEINVSAVEAEGIVGPAIDDFNSHQMAGAAPPLPSSQNSTQDDPGVMGGERDMFVELTSGTDIYSSVSIISGGGLLRLASDTTVSGNAKIVWDGNDGSATSLNPIGLGGLDLTEYQGNTLTGITLRVGADHPNCVVKLRVYTDANHWTEYTATVPESAGGAATKLLTFSFDDIATNRAGGGVEFSNVGAVELTFEGVSAVDGQVSLIGLTGLTTKTADFTAYNKINLGNQVWNDANNNGALDAGEQGISGVKVNLYADVDQNNQYTPGVDTFVATTTTVNNGVYQFTDLLPGQYIVQVDPGNFDSGKALAGLAPSKGTAADPDNNADNDNNGTALAGHGVVSQALALVAANNTVDFGFYGFDLVLDKSVQQMSVSPEEIVDYTVRVVNDGPSTAYNVSFVDNLPAGVIYQSHTVDATGIVLNHSNGTLTGSLGTMASGAAIMITIKAKVAASATGILLNEAEVSAPDEVYTLNNRDEVETPVTPKIDLQVEKSDGEVTVQPGEQFEYTVTVKNNGPSNATGVTVKDLLPANVTFVTASRLPTTTSGDELTWALGNMAAGAQVSFTILVTVDNNFVGTLLNTVEVWGDQPETTMANNKDVEPTPVEALPASIEGNVYHDKDNDGVYDAGEAPIANVVVTLTGEDIFGNAVNRQMTTGADGKYRFANLVAGEYIVTQNNQPAKFKDGKDTLGKTLDAEGFELPINGLRVLDTVADDNRDSDAFGGIVLDGGFAALDYNFGELAVGNSKANFIGRLPMWRR